MRVHAAPFRDAPAEGAGASRPPLLSGALKDRALHLAGTLAGTLCPAPTAGRRDVSLTSGSAGLAVRSAEHTSELQAHSDRGCPLLPEKTKNNHNRTAQSA